MGNIKARNTKILTRPKAGGPSVRPAMGPGRAFKRACVWAGALGVSLSLALGTSAAADPMTFHLATVGTKHGCKQGCAEVIAAEGEITNDTADNFVSFLAEHLQDQDLRPVILIQSPGGTVVGAMQLGTVFRKIGAAVIVAAARNDDQTSLTRVAPGACMSACVYAFFGGKKRVVPSVSRLGIHRMVINERVRDPSGGYDVQHIYGTEDIVSSLSAYTRLMGVNPAVIHYAERISPEAIHIVTPAEIARWRMGSPRL